MDICGLIITLRNWLVNLLHGHLLSKYNCTKCYLLPGNLLSSYNSTKLVMLLIALTSVVFA